MRQIVLKPQDLVVALKLILDPMATYVTVARDLHLSVSNVHGSVDRCVRAGLLHSAEKRAPLSSHRPVVAAIREFIEHGVRYAFPAVRGSTTRGVPTAHAARPLAEHFTDASGDPPPVWPESKGEVRGVALCPLYGGAPAAAATDERLRELLVLIDALRIGRARERELARTMISARLAPSAHPERPG